MKKWFIASLLSSMAITGCGITPNTADSTNEDPQAMQQSAAQFTEMNLYPGAIPGEIKLANQEVIRDPSHPDTFIMDVNQPTIRIYQADPAIATGTAVIICPGGSYKGVSIVKEGYQVAERFNKIGVTAIVLKYRMPNVNTMQDKKTGPLQDVQQAIHLVRSNAAKWGVNPTKVGIMGFSAGGHLASTAATHFMKPVMPEYANENLRPDFQVLVYPVISMKEGVTHKGSRDNLIGPVLEQDDIELYSNETQVSGFTPKAFVVHAQDDKAVPVENSQLYVDALKQNKVAAELLVVPNGGHGFGMRNSVDWFESMTSWFKNNKLI